MQMQTSVRFRTEPVAAPPRLGMRRTTSHRKRRPGRHASSQATQLAVLIAALAAVAVHAGSGIATAQSDTEVVALTRDLVRLDTSNPPGNEGQVATLMAARLAPLGFETTIIQTPVAGKAHLIARLRSARAEGKPVLLSARLAPSASNRSCGASIRSPA